MSAHCRGPYTTWDPSPPGPRVIPVKGRTSLLVMKSPSMPSIPELHRQSWKIQRNIFTVHPGPNMCCALIFQIWNGESNKKGTHGLVLDTNYTQTYVNLLYRVIWTSAKKITSASHRVFTKRVVSWPKFTRVALSVGEVWTGGISAVDQLRVVALVPQILMEKRAYFW